MFWAKSRSIINAGNVQIEKCTIIKHSLAFPVFNPIGLSEKNQLATICFLCNLVSLGFY